MRELLGWRAVSTLTVRQGTIVNQHLKNWSLTCPVLYSIFSSSDFGGVCVCVCVCEGGGGGGGRRYRRLKSFSTKSCLLTMDIFKVSIHRGAHTIIHGTEKLRVHNPRLEGRM